ncbi:MAG: ATP-binding protein [bacterium]|nr:ATP-binding protein [bacterium]
MNATQRKQKLPVDVQSFEIMRTQNYLYVDKTRHIHRMVTEGTFYFLSRPRRFGKSLLVSTLKYLFKGRRDLFDSLWIATQSDWDWQNYPTIALDFNGIPGDTPEQLQHYLAQQLEDIAEEHELHLQSDLPAILFKKLILKLYKKTGKPVVILIDEYDKRIIEHLGKGPTQLEIAKGNRDALKQFFGILKDQAVNEKLRLVFITGVSRFSKVSLFSDLNNLRDISMVEPFVDMLGYTQKELESVFEEPIEELGRKIEWTRAQVLETLARKYNGYRFSKAPLRLYNPFSVLNALNDLEFENYWFESATPSFLVNLLKQEEYNLPQIEGLEVSRTIFTSFELEALWPEALLYQTGYLTIQDVQGKIYTLNYPNQEVKQAFTEALLLGLTTKRSDPLVSSQVLKLPGYLHQENFSAFFVTMQAIFASIPYDIESKRDEAYFHTIFYLIMSASGMAEAQSSMLTCDGRIDLVLRSPETIYIIEFKCNQSAEAALQQIQEKGYADRFRSGAQRIMRVGINFDKEQRNIAEWKIQQDSI